MKLCSHFHVLTLSLTGLAQRRDESDHLLYMRSFYPEVQGPTLRWDPLDDTLTRTTFANPTEQPLTMTQNTNFDPLMKDLIARPVLESRVVHNPCEVANPHNSPNCNPVQCGRSPLVLCFPKTIPTLGGSKIRHLVEQACVQHGMDEQAVQNICEGCVCRTKGPPKLAISGTQTMGADVLPTEASAKRKEESGAEEGLNTKKPLYVQKLQKLKIPFKKLGITGERKSYLATQRLHRAMG